MPLTLLWNSATMPDGCELFEERARSRNRVRGYAGRIGGALGNGGGFNEREVRVRLVMGGDSITDARDIIDDWQQAVGSEFGWLRQLTATMDRRIYVKPGDLDIKYPETVFDVLEVEQTFVAPDPRWYDLTTSSQWAIPNAQYLHGSRRYDVDGSAGAAAHLYYWPAYEATEVVSSIEVTNRYGNLIYNADFAIHETSTQQGLADPWQSDQWETGPYDPFLIPNQDRQYLDIDPGATAQEWITHAIIPYAPTRNEVSPTTDTLVWSADIEGQQFSGDWRFYLRLHALMGTAFGGATAHTVVSPVYGTTGAAVTVAGATWNARLSATMTVTGGLDPEIRQLRPEFVFVGATGLGAPGGGRIIMQEPYLRTDGQGYDYTPHRTITWSGITARYALEADLEERSSMLWAEAEAPTNAMPYLTDASEFFELRPGTNEIHAEVTLTNQTSTTNFPCSSNNLLYLRWTNRWWA